ncbi:MAG: N-acetylglucosamine-6-phosphate deacetylase [Rhodothermales bacterium]|jgi:N-acetylglucosamine-6-phosphate deacetylase
MDRDLLIHLDYCLTPRTRINNAAIVISGGSFFALGGYSAFSNTHQYEVIDMPGCYALPGFVDTHIYGAGGFDCMHIDEGNPADMSRTLARHGVTSFVPTTQSERPERLLTVVNDLAKLCESKRLPGASPVGIHIEGPFISREKSGSHVDEFVRKVDLEEAKTLMDAGKGHVRIFACAPELVQARELIAAIGERGIMPELGHTMADQDAVAAAIEAGARRCSHILNGMEPLKQRAVGLAAMTMTDERMWVELIVDGVHVSPVMIDLICRCIPAAKLIVVSNAMMAAGLDEDGEYQLGPDTIRVVDGQAMIKGGQTLAGATKLLDHNYRSLLRYSHLSQEEVAAACTFNPARSIGLTDRGSIRPGKRADLVILNAEHEVQMTIVKGKIVYRADA